MVQFLLAAKPGNNLCELYDEELDFSTLTLEERASYCVCPVELIHEESSERTTVGPSDSCTSKPPLGSMVADKCAHTQWFALYCFTFASKVLFAMHFAVR